MACVCVRCCRKKCYHSQHLALVEMIDDLKGLPPHFFDRVFRARLSLNGLTRQINKKKDTLIHSQLTLTHPHTHSSHTHSSHTHLRTHSSPQPFGAKNNIIGPSALTSPPYSRPIKKLLDYIINVICTKQRRLTFTLSVD